MGFDDLPRVLLRHKWPYLKERHCLDERRKYYKCVASIFVSSSQCSYSLVMITLYMYHCHFTRFSLRVDPEIIRGDHNPGGRRHIPVLPAANMTPVARIRVGGQMVGE